MLRKTSAFILTLSIFISVNGASPLWKQSATDDINMGNLKKTENLIRNLPEKEKKKNAILIDSILTTIAKVRYDFSMTPETGIAKIKERYPSVTEEAVNYWKDKKYIEYRIIDGKEWWFRKAVSNLWLLDTYNFKTQNILRKKKNYQGIYDNYIDFMSKPADFSYVKAWNKVNVTFTLDVNANAVPAGQKIRAWLPFPYKNGRQRNIKLISASSKPKYSRSSKHHTVYLEQEAIAGKPTHFEINFVYEVGAQTFPANTILTNQQPYDKKSALYRKYTKAEYPHIVVNSKMADLAQKIVGEETSPLLQASSIYNWICKNYPWAGAVDYTTIPNIPQYVLDNGHGDCGQVSLLYISLLRSLGIPARWESGWEISSQGAGMHDWAEAYFEGTGWVPVDVSHGRTVRGEVINDFYKTGIDNMRLATNEGVSAALSPKKKYARNDAVDFQIGEVEWREGGIPSKDWDSNIIINSIESVNYENDAIAK